MTDQAKKNLEKAGKEAADGVADHVREVAAENGNMDGVAKAASQANLLGARFVGAGQGFLGLGAGVIAIAYGVNKIRASLSI